MIAARTTIHAAEPAPRRDLVGKLLLTGIEWTDQRPGLMFAGMGVCWVLCVLLENLL